MSSRYIVRGGLVLSFSILLAVFVYLDLAPSGQFRVVSDLLKEYPSISRLYPYGRVETVSLVAGEQQQSLVGEPVYFDVRLPRKLDQVRIKFIYGGNPGLWRVGLRLPPNSNGGWRYALKPVVNTRLDNSNWRVGEVSFNLKGAFIEDQKVRFIISLPGVEEQETSLIVRSLEVEMTGPSLNWALVRKFFRES